MPALPNDTSGCQRRYSADRRAATATESRKAAIEPDARGYATLAAFLALLALPDRDVTGRSHPRKPLAIAMMAATATGRSLILSIALLILLLFCSSCYYIADQLSSCSCLSGSNKKEQDKILLFPRVQPLKLLLRRRYKVLLYILLLLELCCIFCCTLLLFFYSVVVP